MSYTTTITFPVEQISDDHNIQLIIIFTTDLTASNESYTSTEKKLKVMNWGIYQASYDFESALLVSGNFTLEISDSMNFLDDLFFGSSAAAQATDKRPQIIIKVNSSVKFKGNVIEDSVKFSKGKRRLKITAKPKTDLINKRMVYDEDGNSLNPFSYSSSSYYKLLAMLLDIFQLVDPTLTENDIDIRHDWLFWGERNSDGADFNKIEIESLYQLVDPLYFDNSLGISTCGDLLKKLAIDWCSFMGMLSSDQPFLKKMFLYDENNLQTLEKVYIQEKNYKYITLDYVKVTTQIGDPNEPYEEGTFTELQDKYLIRSALPGFYQNGARTVSGSNVQAVLSSSDYFIFGVSGITLWPAIGDVYSNNGSEFTVLAGEISGSSGHISFERTSGVNDPTASGTLTRVSGVGDASITFGDWGDESGTYTIKWSSDAALFSGLWQNHGALLANFWYTWRGSIKNCRVDRFVVKGVDYDFLKDFNYDGEKFQPISIKVLYPENKTEFEAIYLGDVI